ncbi:MAG: S41 family peptidase [Litorilinea sp.]
MTPHPNKPAPTTTSHPPEHPLSPPPIAQPARPGFGLRRFGLRRRLKQGLSTTVIVGLLLMAFGVGNVTGYLTKSALAQEEDATPVEFGIFWEVWELVERYFVDQDNIDYNEMTYGAIQGMLDALGDENHTIFFPPDVAVQQAESLSGEFEGIGAYVDEDDGQFIIVAPILGSPAEEAGILAGDIVLAVDGLEITGMLQWEVIDMIRGEAGTAVVLTVLHPDATEPVDIEIVRGRIEVPSVVWARIPGTDLVHLQITQFAATTGRDLQTELAEIFEEAEAGTPVAGIVLDLRNNPGGYLSEALRVGSQFLPEGEIILHERDAAENTTTYRSQGRGLAREIPMVVLVNAGSASAAEIIAGSLQENGRAQLVGVATVGTGTVLRPFPLSDGSLVRLGVTNWLTPEYNLIKGEGVQPDVLIEQPAAVPMVNVLRLGDLSPADVENHEDEQFQTALLLMRMQLDNTGRSDVQANPAPPR